MTVADKIGFDSRGRLFRSITNGQSAQKLIVIYP